MPFLSKQVETRPAISGETEIV
ncbi:hypothetical protein IL54_1935 [Sphingobium sp. ba1]|nr:hypothetical protein IL54_1935 [Sphingobium sp. ba1]